MSDASVTVTTDYIGLVDGLHTWEVRDATTRELIGTNQSPYPPCPGDGYTLDEATATWVPTTPGA